LETQRRDAVKFFIDASVYRRELRAYQIVRQRGIDQINGFQIPSLVRYDDQLLAIEMTIVKPPFLLDFAAAYSLDEYGHFEFSQEVIDERESHWAEVFGDRWPQVQTLCNAFTRENGLILLDLSPNNIKFTS
jgi:hypothetical protein